MVPKELTSEWRDGSSRASYIRELILARIEGKMVSRDRNATRGMSGGQGFSLIELLIVVAIILIIAAIAIPNLFRARIAANQAAAVSNVRTITSASIAYSSTYDNGYPPDLATMGGVVPANCNGAVLLDETLTVAPYRKSGYTYGYVPQGPSLPTAPPGCGAAGYNAYLTTAAPTVIGQAGETSYCSDEPGVIYFDPTGVPAASPAACTALTLLQ